MGNVIGCVLQVEQPLGFNVSDTGKDDIRELLRRAMVAIDFATTGTYSSGDSLLLSLVNEQPTSYIIGL